MIPITYDLAKQRMEDRLRDAERHRLVLQAKAATRDQRKATATSTGARNRLTWWVRLRGKAAQVPSTSVSRPSL